MNFTMRAWLFWRSFFLQTNWNYRNYQNIGLTFVMWPFLKKLYKNDPDALPAILTRYLQNFNTHPAMAPFCFGALARQEENIAKAGTAKALTEQISYWAELKRSLSITTASIGDRLFWGTLKPLTLLIALFVWLAQGVNFFEMDLPPNPTLWNLFAAGLTAFVAFNAVVVVVKWKGLEMSYHNDDHHCFGLTHFDWNRTIYNARRIGLVFTVGMIGAGLYYFMQEAPKLDVHFITRAVLVIFFVCISFVTRRLRIPNLYLYLVAVAVFNLVCYL